MADRRWRTHSQNLTDGGPMWEYGRSWLHIGDRLTFGFEWAFFKGRSIGLRLATGGCDRDVTVSIGLWWATFYVSVSGALKFDALDRDWPRETGLWLWADNEWSLVVSLACQNDQWPHKKGWSNSWYLADVLWGRARYTSLELSSSAARVPMPEGNYDCTVTLTLDTWKRPRWPVAKRMRRADVNIPKGIPFPGKGTENYNCGDDALYGGTCQASSVAEAVTEMAKSAMRNRERYPL